MTHREPVARPNGSADPLTAGIRFVAKVLAIAEMDVRKLHHDPTELATRAVQPILWLLIFGQVLNRARAFPTGDIPYLDFLAPGVLAQSILFIAIFYGIAVIWERDLGLVHKFLVSPTPRAALVLGKALAAGLRGLVQMIVVLLLALVLGVTINPNPLSWIGLGVFAVLGAALFSSFSLIVACLVKTRERFMGIGQLLTMPLFFASNALYPISLMPDWLKAVSLVNPLSYEVDALRALMLPGATSHFGVGFDLLVLIGVTAILVWIGAILYPRIVT